MTQNPSPNLHPHTYAGSTHDRAAHLRTNPAWLEHALQTSTTRFLPLWQDQHLLTPTEATLLPRTSLPADPATLPHIFLGLRNDTPLFAVDLSSCPESTLPGPFTPIRPVAATLPAPDAALIAQARTLLAWQNANRFCGRCGAPMQPDEGGNRLRCTAHETHVLFPQISPVVIMLVTDGPRLLLARGTRFAQDRRIFSALAGFVEAGESAEEAVAREIREEVGIEIEHIQYHSSQPWPYPANLMLAFTAQARTTTLTLDPTEIAEAHWFTKSEIQSKTQNNFEIPGPAAIAHDMIQNWLDTPLHSAKS